MSLLVYNTEIHERTWSRYVSFAIIFGLVIVASFVLGNYLGVVLLFFLLGGYLFYSISLHTIIQLAVLDEGLRIDGKVYSWARLKGFALEVDTKTNVMKNIVLIFGDHIMIHTIHDTAEHINTFVTDLNRFVPLMDTFQQTGIEKLARRLKL